MRSSDLTSYEKLKNSFAEYAALATGPVGENSKMDLYSFTRALDQDVFKKRFMDLEPIVMADGHVVAYECLSRPQDEDGNQYSIGPLTEFAYENGFAEQIDELLISNALTKAAETPEKRPITLNISVESLLSDDFWEVMLPKMRKFGTDEIILEVLEHDVALDADISFLETLKEQGLRFALDDFSLGQSHDNRLTVFGDLVDYAKIDGPIVRAYLGDESALEQHDHEDMNEVLDLIRQGAPHAEIIAERVRNCHEAQQIFSLGVQDVQGKYLDLEEMQAVAKSQLICE